VPAYWYPVSGRYLWHDGYWEHEIAHLRGVLADDVKAKSDAAQPEAH